MPSKFKPVAQSHEMLRVGARFRQVRVEAGISQDRLAAAIKVTPNAIRWHEAGAVMLRYNHVVDAARILKAPVSRFTPPMDWTPPDPPPVVQDGRPGRARAR